MLEYCLNIVTIIISILAKSVSLTPQESTIIIYTIGHRLPFTVCRVFDPLAIVVVAVFEGIHSRAMFFALRPPPGVSISIFVGHGSLAIISSHLKFPFVHILTFICEFTLAIKEIVFPWSFIHCPIFVCHFTLAIFGSLLELTLVCSTLSILFAVFARFKPFFPIANINRFMSF